MNNTLREELLVVFEDYFPDVWDTQKGVDRAIEMVDTQLAAVQARLPKEAARQVTAENLNHNDLLREPDVQLGWNACLAEVKAALDLGEGKEK